jgi:hypothetical protein
LPYIIAKIDINSNEKFVKQYIGNNKAMKSIFYRNLDEKVVYSGQNTGAKIAHWINKFIGDLTKEVTCDELEKESYDNDYTLAYFGDVTLPLYKKTYEKYALTEERL